MTSAHGSRIGCSPDLSQATSASVRCSADQVVLHREQRRRRPGAHVGLDVEVLDVGADRLDRDAQRAAAIWRLVRPRASKPNTSTSRSVRPAGRSTRRPRRVEPGRLEDRVARRADRGLRRRRASAISTATSAVLRSIRRRRGRARRTAPRRPTAPRPDPGPRSARTGSPTRRAARGADPPRTPPGRDRCSARAPSRSSADGVGPAPTLALPGCAPRPPAADRDRHHADVVDERRVHQDRRLSASSRSATSATVAASRATRLACPERSGSFRSA